MVSDITNETKSHLISIDGSTCTYSVCVCSLVCGVLSFEGGFLLEENDKLRRRREAPEAAWLSVVLGREA